MEEVLEQFQINVPLDGHFLQAFAIKIAKLAMLQLLAYAIKAAPAISRMMHSGVGSQILTGEVLGMLLGKVIPAGLRILKGARHIFRCGIHIVLVASML